MKVTIDFDSKDTEDLKTLRMIFNERNRIHISGRPINPPDKEVKKTIETLAPVKDIKEKEEFKPTPPTHATKENPRPKIGLKKENRPNEIKLWSKKNESCIVCHTTTKKHMGKGKCTTCYFIKDLPKKTEDVPSNLSKNIIHSLFKCEYQFCKTPRARYIKEQLFGNNGKYFCSKSCRKNDAEMYGQTLHPLD